MSFTPTTDVADSPTGRLAGQLDRAGRWVVAIALVSVYLFISFVVSMGILAPDAGSGTGFGILLVWLASCWAVAHVTKATLGLA